MTWTHEDGGPRRRQTTPGGLGLDAGASLEVDTRTAPVTTMAVAGDEHLFLLRHEPGDCPPCFVERLDPRSLAVLERSPDLAGGPMWPGGLGVAADGSVHVVFGNHAHRLDDRLQVAARRTLPRARPYNSFVPLPDGHLVTKDFGGSLPHQRLAPEDREPCELVVLDPIDLEIVACAGDAGAVDRAALRRRRRASTSSATRASAGAVGRHRARARRRLRGHLPHPRRADLRLGLRPRRRRRVVPRRRRRRRGLRRHPPGTRALDGPAPPRAGRPRVRRGVDGGGVRAARRPRGQPAGGRRGQRRRRRLRQRQRLHDRASTWTHWSSAGGATRTTPAT